MNSSKVEEVTVKHSVILLCEAFNNYLKRMQFSNYEEIRCSKKTNT